MILVTGGTGLVGSHLLYELLTANKTVKAIYRTEEKQAIVKRIFSYYTEDYLALFNKIEWVEADLLNIPQLIEAFENVDYVYHCAAMISFDPKDYHKLRKTNIEGTANIVNLCISNSIKKLCYVSSVATISDSEKSKHVNEETDWNSEKDNNVYAITKYGAEIEVWRGTQEGLNAVIVNPGVIIGPGLWHEGTGGIFTQIYKGLSFYTKGHVASVYVKDVTVGMMRLMESSITNERFIMVGEHVTYKRFLGLIAENLQKKPPHIEAGFWILSMAWRLDWLKNLLTGRPRKLMKPMIASSQSTTIYDNEKIKDQLNFEFTPIEKSAKQTAKMFLRDNQNLRNPS
ncbi:SDR family oxidoreductase [Bizionia myxarmorum]|uniref:NAD-dependent epimerase/dehydratase family protein n=1 Tax=Bizionia myxarmorum TaxID=291186 RepID=A0A5D0RE90_9FLAO|nr:SDR family oxidoreductase [Bizionia myxarmorum]TYB79018.1 NAD-dependent epimerase/dehydratase family protein [Bizionia myxarmorum]